MAKARRKPTPKPQAEGATPEQLAKRYKLAVRSFESWFGERPSLWEPQRLRFPKGFLRSLQKRHAPKSDEPPPPPVRKLSGKKWVPIAFDRRRDELLAMTITEASDALAEESGTAASGCAKQLEPRYIEKLLRDLNVWPKARRNSLKQRPK